ncbi:MAG: hypothetical protein KKH98_06875, partial [Spirochaetes bacterium]|nr:hypothetical protein [Spirochaetota bacterium]
KQQKVGKLFREFIEIAYSLENLENIKIYISHFPKCKKYEKNGITRTIYLKYHIENYFNEIYILRERLNKFLNIFKKYYKSNEKIKRHIKILQEFINKCFINLTNSRDSHVHEYRYKDKDIERLDSWDLLSRGIKYKKGRIKKEDIIYIYYEDSSYKRIKSDWIKRMIDNQEQIMKIIDEYCKIVYDYIFNKNGKLII